MKNKSNFKWIIYLILFLFLASPSVQAQSIRIQIKPFSGLLKKKAKDSKTHKKYKYCFSKIFTKTKNKMHIIKQNIVKNSLEISIIYFKKEIMKYIEIVHK